MTGFALRRPGKPTPASETAAEWLLLQEERALSEDEEREFAEWLAEDEAHRDAYENALWALDAVARHAGEDQLIELRKQALAARGKPRQRFWTWTGGIGAAAATAALVAVWAMQPATFNATDGQQLAQQEAEAKAEIFRTGVGERAVLTLPDGSVATLDTDSALEVAYTESVRRVNLVKGQALFEVAHGKPIPFEVLAGDQLITAVGTTFNVRLEGEQIRVAMVEGRVKVRPMTSEQTSKSEPIGELTLITGEALTAQPGRPLQVAPVDARQVASWKGGLLTFNDTPLSEAVAEINRYTARPITIADPAVGSYRVTGVFQSNDPQHFAQAMREVFPIAVEHGPDGAPTLRNGSN